MKIVVDGQSFDLVATELTQKLANHTPEEVREHSVLVDGTAWPVKQAFAVATGLERSRFTSSAARRVLRNLGLTVDGQALPLSAHNHGRQKLPPFEFHALMEVDQVKATIVFTWRRVGEITLVAEGALAFPLLPARPGLYRIEFVPLTSSDTAVHYVGESKDLRGRARDYRGATTDREKGRTSRRIHIELVKHLDAGGRVEVAVALEIAMDGHEGDIDLRRTSARRLAENVAVLRAQLDPGLKLLNIDFDPHQLT